MAQLNIRGINDDDAARIRRAAQVRGLTLAEYVAALSQFHRSILDDAWRKGITLTDIQLNADAFGLGPVQE